MKNFEKYTKNLFLPPTTDFKWATKNFVDKTPIWCSVDLRDGNQALITPMNLKEKILFFEYLVKLGFKEIEVGFPAASETEFLFLRELIEKNLIPDDVTIQVLTQSREHIIKKTFDAIRGIKKAIVHLYNSTSVVQREQVFKKDKKEIINIAKDGAKVFNELAKETDAKLTFEYSPESFTGTEMDFALEICNAVLDIWQPSATNKVIINLPATVEVSMPHVYANQIEYISDNIKYRENVILSVHPHNDRGCAVAATEMAILAGAQRVEGTLFGNGERTGNADIITIALNMYSQGIDPKLNLENIPAISATYEKYTNLSINDRHPYVGRLVYAAFSGSHQDAIAKGMIWQNEGKTEHWSVPYLPIDPKDIGREYDNDVIRINSQSGKGGIGYLLEQNYGYVLPPKMRETFSYHIKDISDKLHRELMPGEIFDTFVSEYVNIGGNLKIGEYHTYTKSINVSATVHVEYGKSSFDATGSGNGRLDAISNCIKSVTGLEYNILQYHEHALSRGSDSIAAAYVAIMNSDGKTFWGCGTHNDIITASVNALVSAINRL